MPRYTEVVFHVPCVFRAGEQQVLLSPDRNGTDTLTARDVLQMRLPNVRLVTLTSCTSRQTMGYFDDPWDLPGPVLSALALQAVRGGDGSANLIPPTTYPDPPPLVRG
jgi:hypothetical protein